MKLNISKNHWILIGVIVAILALYYFLVVRRKPKVTAPPADGKTPGGENSGYMATCGQNEVGMCVGCIPTSCPPGSDTPGEQSNGCKCDGSGNCLPVCGAGGSLVMWNGATWITVPRTQFKPRRNTAVARR